MWLMVHHPRSYYNDNTPPPPEVKDRLFITSIEVIEFSYLLERNENTAKWGWLFRSYMQWQSVAFVLSEICARAGHFPPASAANSHAAKAEGTGASVQGQWTQEVERGWRAVESVYNVRFIQPDVNHRGMLWRPMRTLWRKARAAREHYLKGRPGGRFAGKGVEASLKHGDLTEGRFDGSGSLPNGIPPEVPNQSESPEDVPDPGDGKDVFVDTWAGGWQNDHLNILGATGAAFGLDMSEIMSPKSSSSGGSGAQSQQPKGNLIQQQQSQLQQQQHRQSQQRSIPTGVQGVDPGAFGQFGSAASGGFSGQQNQNVRHKVSTTQPGTTNASATTLSNTTSPDTMNMESMDVNMDGMLGADNMGQVDPAYFFNWGGWNPGVGDFTVGGFGAPGGGLGVADGMLPMDDVGTFGYEIRSPGGFDMGMSNGGGAFDSMMNAASTASHGQQDQQQQPGTRGEQWY
jgi:hypothetical protein